MVFPLAQFVGPYQHDDLDLHKESLGTVPVAPDGSVQFRIPAGVPIQLQAVDTNGVAVFTMRSFIYAQKGEVQGCTGCHENKFKSGAAKYVVQSPNGRATHDPKPEVNLGYTGPFSFTKSVQPIFDRHCISCRVLWLVKPEDRARFLLLVKASLKPKPAHDVLGTCGRDDACECNSCWVRRGGYNKPKGPACPRP